MPTISLLFSPSPNTLFSCFTTDPVCHSKRASALHLPLWPDHRHPGTCADGNSSGRFSANDNTGNAVQDSMRSLLFGRYDDTFKVADGDDGSDLVGRWEGWGVLIYGFLLFIRVRWVTKLTFWY